MARLNLSCACGWNFFLPSSTTGHEVSCPSCGQVVPIPGRVPGQDVPMSAGAVAAEHQKRQTIIRLSIGAGAVVIVAGIVVALLPGSKPPPEVKPERRRHEIVRDRPAAPEPKPPVVHPQPESAPPLFTETQIEELRNAAFHKTRLINLTTIVAEIIRYRDPQNEAYAKLQSDIVAHETALRECQANLAKVQQTVELPPYCAKGDRITWFNGADLRTIYPGAAAQILHNWALSWRPGEGASYPANLDREGKEVPITFIFTGEWTDLQLLLRHPVLTAEVLTGGGSSDRAALPAELVQRYQATLQALPAGYLNLLPTVDTLRITRVMQSKAASTEDADWFKSRVLDEFLQALEADSRTIRRKLADLEPLVKDNPAPDAVILKGGQRIECKVIKEADGKIRLKSRVGSRVVSSDEIQQILPDKGIGTEAAGRIEASKGSVEKLLTTMTWCGQKALNNEKQYVACQILLLEPVNDAARTALGIARPTFPAAKPK